MSTNTTFLHRLHRGLADPAVACLGPLTLKLRAYYLLPFLSLPVLTGDFRLGGLSNHAVMTYRGGWALGEIATNADRQTQRRTLAGALSEMPSEDGDWFKEGFSDGLKGRKARYDVPDDLFGED
ncbi:hypothetical protein OVA24_06770 [Luteolibacter sp. SL250]|uniref:hypothetical protein n=1 Tax=Luteolibacter sp. SL250 TaxID=2995170 RepID=UPI00226D874A|nr:hypothetical protein [Luteolibacter sp. SL250]WAC21084.1 hypothetical protein OVA24_06770 [Luteolibacter sp. SL250]